MKRPSILDGLLLYQQTIRVVYLDEVKGLECVSCFNIVSCPEYISIYKFNMLREVRIVSLESQRDPGTEEFINTLENNHIYRDLRAKYDELTDDNEEINSDEHDELASKYISEKYRITKEEVVSLYSNFENEISMFHQRRLNFK